MTYIGGAIREIKAADVQFDEVAVVFRHEIALDQFVEDAIESGLEHFNSVPRDTMRNVDREHSFDVRFEFLRIPECSWRIEAMTVLSGISPIHSRVLRLKGDGAVVHLSYKLPSLEAYLVEVDRLRHGEGCLPLQAEYVNSYGRFCYLGDPAMSKPYIKPRINLRD